MRSDMKSCSPPSPTLGGPGLSCLFGGMGGLLAAMGGGLADSGARAGGGGGGGGNDSASPANDGGGGGTKSGGASLKSGGGGGGSSSFSRGGGGGGGGRKSLGGAGKPVPLALWVITGLALLSEDPRTGGGGGRLDFGGCWALGVPGSWLPKAGFLSLVVSTCLWASLKTALTECAAWGI